MRIGLSLLFGIILVALGILLFSYLGPNSGEASFEHSPATEQLLDRAKNGSPDELAELLDRGADPNAPNENGRTALMLAAENNSAQAVKTLLDAGGDANQRLNTYDDPFDELDLEGPQHPELGFTPLTYAARSNDLETVNVLLDAGAEVNVSDATGRTPLMRAAYSNSVPIARRLIDAGAAIDPADNKGRTALWFAAGNSLKMVNLLLKHGADPHVTTNRDQTLLHRAAKSNKPRILERLLDEGLDVGARDTWEGTPLCSAITMGGAEAARVLLDAGADPNVVYGDGNSPLERTADQLALSHPIDDTTEKVELLLQYGADPNGPTADATPPLVAAGEANAPDAARLLIEHGADLDATDEDGQTALLHALSGDNVEVARVLLEAGADFDTPGMSEGTAYERAARTHRPELTALVLDRMSAAEVERHADAMLVEACTELHGKAEILRLILDRTPPGYTPPDRALKQAITNHTADFVRILLDAGADPDMPDYQDQTALDVARNAKQKADGTLYQSEEEKEGIIQVIQERVGG